MHPVPISLLRVFLFLSHEQIHCENVPAILSSHVCDHRKYDLRRTPQSRGKVFALTLTISLFNKSVISPQVPLLKKLDTCDCTGTNDTGNQGVKYICHDPRLGPARLPKTFPLLSFVSDYDRFGGQTPGNFLKRWTDANGYYVYPPQNGFQLNVAGQPILGNMTLLNGTKVDRFGSEYGMKDPYTVIQALFP